MTEETPRPQPRFRRPLHGTRLACRVRRAVQLASASNYARAHNKLLPRRAPTLHFYPHRPARKATISRIVQRLGMRIGFAPRVGELAIAWDTDTWFSDRALRALPADAINLRCLDISKSHVDRAWHEVSGYSLAIDPLVTDGPIVVKSERNGQHDGQVVDGPLTTRRPGRVYQRFVDSLEGETLVEMRTAIIGEAVPSVFVKWRPATSWYGRSARAILRSAEDIYSDVEIQQLLLFAERIGLEYGELDVMRDKRSGLIYVLDANRTPRFTASKATAAERDRAIDAMAEAFRQLLEGRSPHMHEP